MRQKAMVPSQKGLHSALSPPFSALPILILIPCLDVIDRKLQGGPSFSRPIVGVEAEIIFLQISTKAACFSITVTFGERIRLVLHKGKCEQSESRLFVFFFCKKGVSETQLDQQAQWARMASPLPSSIGGGCVSLHFWQLNFTV